jgi:hypothetical protein
LDIKALDPYWIRIRIGTDPDEMNADPQPCGQAEVSFLTDFRCGKGGLFRHPGETVRILQSVVVARAHHVAVVIAGRALTPAKHTVLFIISVLRIRIRDPVPFLPLEPGSGPRITTPYFLELSDKFLGKKFYNSLKTGPNLFLQHLKNKIIFNLVKFVATKKGLTTNFFLPSLLLLFLDPGSGIRDPGWIKIRIRDKHPGSATLYLL